jgi:hypothetical protein
LKENLELGKARNFICPSNLSKKNTASDANEAFHVQQNH